MNFGSIDILNQGYTEMALQILLKCDELLSDQSFGQHFDLKALTYNHLGCCYRRNQGTKTAMMYFQQALTLILEKKSKNYLGLTYLNISALHSSLGNHQKSLDFARQSLVESQSEFFLYQKFNSNIYEENAQNYEPEYINAVSTLVISFYNVAKEE